MLITGKFIPDMTKAHLEVSHEPGVSYWVLSIRLALATG